MDDNTFAAQGAGQASGTGGQPPADDASASQGGSQPAGGAAKKGGLSGIMEEDVDVGNLVANASSNQQQSQQVILAMTVPPHPNTTFDEPRFLTLLAGSISLTLTEKQRIVQAIGQLSQYQIDELFKIFDEERDKFAELEKKHAEQVAELERQNASGNPEALLAKQEEEEKKQKEAEQIALLMQQMGQGEAANDGDYGSDQQRAA